jgi:hypothetical protein
MALPARFGHIVGMNGRALVPGGKHQVRRVASDAGGSVG